MKELRPHEENKIWHDARMAKLAQLGSEMYHNPHFREYTGRLASEPLIELQDPALLISEGEEPEPPYTPDIAA